MTDPPERLPDRSPYGRLRVIDMTEALAGPFCAMMLGDLGADVIKIERRGTGDQSRSWGPPFLDGESAYFLSVNRNKRSLEIDIKDPADLEVLHALLTTADVFLTNLPRLESLQRAGLDHPSCRERNPRLVHAAISGYGHSGPKAGRAGYDLIAQAEAGTMALTGEADDPPMRFPTAMADITAGLYALIGIQAALYARDDRLSGTGLGQHLDIALVDSQLTWLANVAGTVFATGERPAKMGNAHPAIAPYQPMQAGDGMIIVAVGTERLWRKLCAVLGVSDSLMQDPRFASNERRNTHRLELVAAIEEILATKSAATWVEEMVAVGIPAGPILFPEQSLDDPHLRARGMIVELEHPVIGTVKSIASPLHLSSSAPTYRRYPPRLGEHNQEIRRELEERSDRQESRHE